MQNGGSFHSYVAVYQRVAPIKIVHLGMVAPIALLYNIRGYS